MSGTCKTCGRTEFEALADAKTLGLEQEYLCGIYICCQLAEWADEQWLAWVEATRQDVRRAAEAITPPANANESELALVPVRLRRPRVPWYRHFDERS